MDKTAIKNFAVWARRKLIVDIQQKAYELGITEKEIKEPQVVTTDTMIVGDRTLNKAEMNQRKSLVSRVKDKGFNNVIEEVAYTWFNRFIAIRFMEVNEYLPTGVRVLSSHEPEKKEPDIIKEALNTDLNLDRELVYRLQDAHETELLFRYLLVKQCNALNEILPGLFEEIEDYTEILLPSNLLHEGSVIRQLVDSINEEDFKEQVEIIGWMYQYYITETNELVYDGSMSKSRISKELLPAATQIFTPDWVVKYMVENSLGRLWLEEHTDTDIKSKWKYYISSNKKFDKKTQFEEGSLVNTRINLEEIKVIDPAMGSGHILVYAFDVFMDMYKTCGYTEREATKLILQNNLFGLDIDDRAYQLAYFAVMMKARFYNRRIFNERITPNLCSVQESNHIKEQWITSNNQLNDFIEYFTQGLDEKEKTNQGEDLKYLLDVFNDAKEYGSILHVKKVDFKTMKGRIKEIGEKAPSNLFEVQYRNILFELISPLIKQAKIMSQKYDVVVTNPPYLNSSRMSQKLLDYVGEKFPDNKSDFSMIFYQKSIDNYCKENGFIAFITTTSWMFLKSFEVIRKRVIRNLEFETLVDFGTELFEGKVGHNPVVAWVNKNCHPSKNMPAIRLTEYCYSKRDQKEHEFFNENNRYESNQKDFLKIPGSPVAYWVSNRVIRAYEIGQKLGDLGKASEGIKTGNNEVYLRYWYEISIQKFSFSRKNYGFKWYPHHKGGEYRKWYGNMEWVINWENDGYSIKMSSNSGLQGKDMYFKEVLCWTKITSKGISMRYIPENCLFDSGSPAYKSTDDLLYCLAFVNSCIGDFLLKSTNPTLNCQVGDIKALPLVIDNGAKKDIEGIVKENITISKEDWDSFELSWDFIKHPLVPEDGICNKCSTIEEIFKQYKSFTEKRFAKLKENEEELNRKFIEIYGLQGELFPEVDYKDITISIAELRKDIKSFISYAVGCMFGRYSLDVDSLVNAGEELDISKYKTFIPDKDNIIPITDDQYFDDDLIGRFIEFIRVVFGDDLLEQNLDFIASALNCKGSTSRDIIRQYFLNDFYQEHVKINHKKPIYWLFDSGKQDGFKALIYMHRYDEFTVAKVRTDYLHKLQKSYEAEIKRLDIVIDSSASEREKANAKKKKEKILKQMEECRQYDQVIAHVANQRIKIDLDDGVSVNYAQFQGIEIPQGEGRKPLKADLLAKI